MERLQMGVMTETQTSIISPNASLPANPIHANQTPGSHGGAHSRCRADQEVGNGAITPLAGDYAAILCGADAFTRRVLHNCLPRLKVLSKYDIGVDKVDLQAATELRIPVTFCPGV